MDDTDRLEGLTQLLEHTIQRLMMLEADMHDLIAYLQARDAQADDLNKLPLFRQKPPVFGENPPESP